MWGTIRDHSLVREARENFRRELEGDRNNLAQESPAVNKASEDIQKLVQDMPDLAQQPDFLNKRLAAVHNPFYFFALGSWQAAPSTGALAYMPTEEVGQYGSADFAVRGHSQFQKQALDAQERATTFFAAHPNLAPDRVARRDRAIPALLPRGRHACVCCQSNEGNLHAAYSKTNKP